MDSLRGEALLRLAPGRRVLDVGHGSTEIARWIDGVCETLTTLESAGLGDPATGEVVLSLPDESFDLTYSLATLPHLGHDEDSSDRAVRSLLAEAARVTKTGGLLAIEIDNPRSLRGAAHGIRHPITTVSSRGVLVDQRRVSRYDTVSRLLEFAPRSLQLVDVFGIRVFLAVPETLMIPIIGRVLTRLEWFARDSELLRQFGAHQLVVLRKDPAPGAGRNAVSGAGFDASDFVSRAAGSISGARPGGAEASGELPADGDAEEWKT